LDLFFKIKINIIRAIISYSFIIILLSTITVTVNWVKRDAEGLSEIKKALTKSELLMRAISR